MAFRVSWELLTEKDRCRSAGGFLEDNFCVIRDKSLRAARVDCKDVDGYLITRRLPKEKDTRYHTLCRFPANNLLKIGNVELNSLAYNYMRTRGKEEWLGFLSEEERERRRQRELLSTQVFESSLPWYLNLSDEERGAYLERRRSKIV